MAQRTVIEPLAPVQPRLRLPTPVVQLNTARSTVTKPPPAPRTEAYVAPPQLLYILNSTIIVGPDLLDIQPNDIKAIMVYRERNAPWQWRDLATHGIIDIAPKEKKKLKTRSFADIGKMLGLSGKVDYTINGMLVFDDKLLIAPEAIGEISIAHATSTKPLTTVAIRIKPPKPSPPPPPGTIRIRGTASR